MTVIRSVDIRGDGIADTLASAVNLSVWALLRRLGSAATTSDVATAIGMDAAQAKRILDALADAGLIERLPLRANRRQPTYRALSESIRVTYDPAHPGDRAAADRTMAAIRMHLDAEITRARSDPDAARGGLDRRTYVSAQLDRGESAEVAGLLSELLAIIESAQARIAKDDPAAAREANTHIVIDVTPALAGAVALPPVHFVDRVRAAELEDAPQHGRLATLAPREREVAIMLANGKTRPEISRELGVSANTVATISKRVYAKLGVRRRAELSNRVRRGAAT